MPDMKKPLLIGSQGCGSAIVECAFGVAKIPFAYEEVNYSAGSPTRARLLEVNPLGQVPALVLPDGTVMTESFAMLHYIADRAPRARLIPPPGDASRAAFYRWAAFLIAAVYPTFTYGDEPGKWVRDKEGAKQLREATDRHRESLWRQMEAGARSPWFLGERMSALDLYVTVMMRWRPGRKWFAANAPKLLAIAEQATALPAVKPVIEKNFS